MVNLSDPILDTTHDLFGVATPKHHDDATDRLGNPIGNNRPRTTRGADADLGNIVNMNRDSVGLFQNDTADILDGLNESNPSDEVLLIIMRELTAAAIGIVEGQCLIDIVEG